MRKGWRKERVFFPSMVETSLPKNMLQCRGQLQETLREMPKAAVELPVSLGPAPPAQ